MSAIQSVKATIDGQEYTLTYNSTDGTYQSTITAPSKSSYNQSGGYYNVSVTAEDSAGNEATVDASDPTLGNAMRLVVTERVAPVLTITYPTASSMIINNKPTFRWKVTDDDSGVNPDTIGITIDSGLKITGSSITKTVITGGYECSYVPTSALSDGSHTVKVDASDNDGNVAIQKSVTFKVDTVPPTLVVTTPPNNDITNNKSCSVVGTTNDVTSSPVTVTVKLNSGTAEAATVSSAGAFSKTVELVEGTNTIVVTATDSAGKTSTVTRTVTLDTRLPEFSSVTLTPNPVDAGKTYVITVTVE